MAMDPERVIFEESVPLASVSKVMLTDKVLSSVSARVTPRKGLMVDLSSTAWLGSVPETVGRELGGADTFTQLFMRNWFR